MYITLLVCVMNILINLNNCEKTKSRHMQIMFVKNPIESNLPSHWLPVDFLKKVIEMRARPCTIIPYEIKSNKQPTNKKFKLKLALGFDRFKKSSKHYSNKYVVQNATPKQLNSYKTHGASKINDIKEKLAIQKISSKGKIEEKDVFMTETNNKQANIESTSTTDAVSNSYAKTSMKDKSSDYSTDLKVDTNTETTIRLVEEVATIVSSATKPTSVTTGASIINEVILETTTEAVIETSMAISATTTAPATTTPIPVPTTSSTVLSTTTLAPSTTTAIPTTETTDSPTTTTILTTTKTNPTTEKTTAATVTEPMGDNDPFY